MPPVTLNTWLLPAVSVTFAGETTGAGGVSTVAVAEMIEPAACLIVNVIGVPGVMVEVC